MKKGDQVRVIQPVIQGEIIARQVDESTDDVRCLVRFNGPDGQPHERWFAEAELQQVTA